MYDFGMELFENHAVSEKTYARALDLFGAPGVVEMAALIGYYAMVAMSMIAHEMPLPEGAKPPLVKRQTRG
jgi:4-carboxymuconolactone decarboxylase